MGYCYILYSASLGRYYIGATQEGVEQRLLKHNLHAYGTGKFTAITTDWELFLDIACEDYAHAVRIEKHIKRMKSTVYLNNLKRYPEMVEKLKEKYKGI